MMEGNNNLSQDIRYTKDNLDDLTYHIYKGLNLKTFLSRLPENNIEKSELLNHKINNETVLIACARYNSTPIFQKALELGARIEPKTIEALLSTKQPKQNPEEHLQAKKEMFDMVINDLIGNAEERPDESFYQKLSELEKCFKRCKKNDRAFYNIALNPENSFRKQIGDYLDHINPPVREEEFFSGLREASQDDNLESLFGFKQGDVQRGISGYGLQKQAEIDILNQVEEETLGIRQRSGDEANRSSDSSTGSLTSGSNPNSPEKQATQETQGEHNEEEKPTSTPRSAGLLGFFNSFIGGCFSSKTRYTEMVQETQEEEKQEPKSHSR